MSERKKAIHLTNKQKWKVAKFMIENKGVKLVDKEDGDVTYIFRMKLIELAKEVSIEVTPIRATHVKDCMDFYLEVCKMTNNLPQIPKEEGYLKEVEELKLVIKNMEEIEKLYKATIEDHKATIEDHRNTLRKAKIKLYNIKDILAKE